MMKRHKYNLSFDRLFSCNAGYIVPIGITEVLPGDSFRHSVSTFIRVAPLVAPVMHPVHAKIHHWYIPTRLIWDDFETFITGGPDGLDSSEPPTITAPESGFGVGSLHDYLGVPPDVGGLEVSALPARAMALTYNEWYRDGTLQEEVPLSTESGPDETTNTGLLRADWEKDYFTTARPQPQLGPSVLVPLIGEGQAFTVESDGTAPTFKEGSPMTFNQAYDSSLANYTFTYDPQHIMRGNVQFYNVYNGLPGTPTGGLVSTTQTSNEAGLQVSSSVARPTNYQARAEAKIYPGVFDNTGLRIATSGSGGVGTTVNALREAFAIERFMEHRSLFGARYSEYLRYLGIHPSDARLQRPEYLGGGKQTIQFSEVLQTAEGTQPVGTMRGHGMAAFKSNSYRRFFEEHGFVLSVMIIRPVAIYAQGLPRMWSRKVKEDYWQKELEHIGEQEVLNKELYAAHSEPDGPFGYQSRYQEYRSHESNVAGEFRTLLDYWHMARIFDSDPALNSDFLECVPTDRIYASTETDQFYVMAHHSLVARRLLSRY